MKKIILGLVMLGMIIGTSSVFAQTPFVYLNGEQLTFEVEPYIAQERTMVPFRKIFEAVGVNVMWDEDMKTVIAAKPDGDAPASILLQVGLDYAFVKGERVELDKATEIVDGYTFVPLRFVMESLGADVDWDEENYSVIITTK